MAYALATGVSYPAAWFTVRILERIFLGDIDPMLIYSLIWMGTAGIPSLKWANRNLTQSLGKKQPVTVRATGVRNVPVGGTLGDIATSIFTPALTTKRQPPAMQVAEVFTIQRTLETGRRVILGEDWCLDFVKGTWSRQRRGEKYPMSRPWWVDDGRRIRREEYDLIMDVLDMCDLITGGARRLRWPALTTMNELKHHFGGWSGDVPDPGQPSGNWRGWQAWMEWKGRQGW